MAPPRLLASWRTAGAAPGRWARRSAATGTRAAAANGRNATAANTAEYPAEPIAAATTGGVAAANAFCPVFWMPRARPTQDEPARAATAVNATPLALPTATAAP